MRARVHPATLLGSTWECNLHVSCEKACMGYCTPASSGPLLLAKLMQDVIRIFVV